MTQKTILCYGDSNTWGFIPQSDHTLPKKRYPRAIRWPGALQALLGDDYHIIEEGLNSRTTNLDHAPPPDRNGKNYLPPCLYTHAPIDLVILALGGNDTKTYFNRTAEDIKNGLAELVDIIQSSKYGIDLTQAPKVLIITPAIPYAFIEEFEDENGVSFLQGAVKKSEQLISLYETLAQEKNCYYLDLSKEVLPSKIDGVHYDKSAHLKCAEMLAAKIQSVF